MPHKNSQRNKLIDDGLERNLFQKGYTCVVGIDEVGRGSWAGPVVVSAFAYTPKSDFISSVRDSKMLTSKKREELYIQLTQNNYSIGYIESQDIDKINVTEATKQAITIATSSLDIDNAFFIIDGSFPNAFSFKHQCIINGDEKHYSIAAASIVAKVFRDRLMREYSILFPEYGFDTNVGYGTSKHRTALSEFGVCPLHRKSYKPIKHLLDEGL